MFERSFNRFFNNFSTRGFCAEGNFRASESAYCDHSARRENNKNTVNLLSLGTVIAVSIFVALRLIVIRLVSLISLVIVGIIDIIRVIIIGLTPPERPALVSAP